VEVSCLLESLDGGALDDYGTAVLRYRTGAVGTLTASRISHGRENDLGIEIDGTRAALRWRQEEPNQLLLRANGEPHRILTRDPGAALTSEVMRASCRLPAGLPEGFLEAFANVFTAAFQDMIRRAAGGAVADPDSLYPSVRDGVEGIAFVTRCLASSRQRGAWMRLQ
jgi:predicted dehydrogenase